MSDGTHISWTSATWNVVTGCTKVSPGCDNCYITRTPPFRMHGRKWDGDGTGASTDIRLHPDRMFLPFRWRKPRRVFVCSLADLFHDAVPELHIAKVWATMARTPRHTYQILTKRHARLRSLLNSHDFRLAVEAICGPQHPVVWPLPNVWLGVTAEDQTWADIRIPALLDTPAAVRWISAEPLLGPVDMLDPYLIPGPGCPCETDPTAYCAPTLDWVVVGCESGPGARPMDLQWASDVVRHAREASCPVHVKQLPTGPNGRATQDMDTFPADLRIRQYPGGDQ